MKKILLSLIGLFILLNISYAQNIKQRGNTYYFADRIVVQFKSAQITVVNGKAQISESLNKIFKQYGIKEISKLFNTKDVKSVAAEKLNKMFVVQLEKEIDPMYLSGKLSKLNEIEFAEPYYLYETVYTPNDPSLGSQYAITKIKADLAWDISKGDTTVVIGIVDTGVDWNHPDLAANIWKNRDEIPNNNVDDDNNGFVDDIRGWDFGGLDGTPDNDPMEDRPDHGTLCAGCASAVTDNGIGIAGVGFNCKVMAIKTSRDDVRTNQGKALITNGYDGILYGVDNGCSIINCSWGGSVYSILAKTVIDYAVEHDVLVVAAMGNENVELANYPAKYAGVFAVASSTSEDKRSSFSNYGYDVDVTAPGTNIFSTWMDDTYLSASGTSLSSPITAGLCGLVKSVFPNYTAKQIGEQVRTNCDDLDVLNPIYANKLGKGRINAFASLTNTNSKSIRLESVEYFDDGDGTFEPNENIQIKAHFVNYLNPINAVSINLSCTSPYVTVENGSFSTSSIGTLEIFDNNSSLFTIKISNTVPQNAEVVLMLTYSDGENYNDFQAIDITLNQTYATQNVNNIGLTITNKGTFGFNDYSTNSQGDGFIVNNGGNLLFEGGLIYGTAEDKVVDGVRSDDNNVQTGDFFNVTPIIINVPGEIADGEGFVVFNDNNAGTNKIGIETSLKSYQFTEEPYDNSMILRYVFKNTSGAEISNFYAGLFFDWDIDASSSGTNYAVYDPQFRCAVIYDNSVSDYVAVGQAWTWGDDRFYAIQNDGADGGLNIYDGFTKAEKWMTLTTGLTKTSAGPQDVATVNSAGPFVIPVNGELEVAFILATGEGTDAVRQSVAAAREKYLSLPTDVEDETINQPIVFALEQNYPNPFNPTTNIKYSIPETEFVTLKVYDVMGREVSTLVNKQMNAGNYDVSFNASKLSSGVYIYSLKAGNKIVSKKMMMIK